MSKVIINNLLVIRTSYAYERREPRRKNPEGNYRNILKKLLEESLKVAPKSR